MSTSVRRNAIFNRVAPETNDSGSGNHSVYVAGPRPQLEREQTSFAELRAAVKRGLTGPAGKLADEVLTRLEAKYQHRVGVMGIIRNEFNGTRSKK